MRAVPAVGIMKPASMRIVVDLPAPFGPRKPSTSPRPTLNETSSTAVKLPKRLVSPVDLDQRRFAVGSRHAVFPQGFPLGGGNSGIAGHCKRAEGWMEKA